MKLNDLANYHVNFIVDFRFAYLIMGSLLGTLFSYGQPGDDTFDSRREKMVESQIQNRGITDEKVLNAFRKVPRHLFVPSDRVWAAYFDRPLGIGEGQTISQPYMVAYMTDILELQPTDTVLEIGTGSGYQAAILGELCKHVYTIEIFKSLGDRAEQLLDELGYENITVKVGDGYKGWPEHAPFDAIIVTCAPTNIPQPLQDQLKEGGKMIIPVGSRPPQRLVLLEKKGGKIKQKAVLSVAFVPMINEKRRKY